MRITTMARRARWVVLFALSLALVGIYVQPTTPALAQPNGKGPAGKGPQGKGPAGKGPQGKGAQGKGAQGKGRQRIAKLRQRLFQKRLGLDDAKATKVEAILRDHVTKQRVAKKRMREANREIRQLLRADSDDQQAYGKALTELTAAQNELEKLRATHMAELDGVLTPKQQAQLIQSLHQIRRHLARAKRDSRKPRRPRRPRIPRGPGPRRFQNPGF